MLAARAEALGAGEVKFVGAPCPRCRGTVRYVSSGRCVPCAYIPKRRPREPNDREARKAAAAMGALIYTSPCPCKRCGGRIRRTYSWACIDCRVDS